MRQRHQVELLPVAASGLRQLQEKGLGLIVITNQSGVGRGFFERSRLDVTHGRLCDLLQAEGVWLDGIYVCPHRPEDGCRCRKPKLGLLESAASELGFEPRDSFVIGDKACDIEVGRQVGAATFLVRTGYGAQIVAETALSPDYIVDDVWDAAQVIRLLLAEERL